MARSKHRITHFAPTGDWAIREIADRKYEYRDKLLFEHLFEMFKGSGLGHGLVESKCECASNATNLLEHVIWGWQPWLRQKLDSKQAKEAKELLFTLVEHPLIGVAEKAIWLIGEHRIKEAINLIEQQTRSDRRKPDGAAGFTCTTAELAERVMVKLTVPENDQHSHLDELEARQRSARRNEERLRRQESNNWPTAIAVYRDSYAMCTTLKSGEDILSDQESNAYTRELHVYEYAVEGVIYGATFEGDKLSQIRLHYNPITPSENKLAK